MKKLILFIVLMIGFSAYSQDSINLPAVTLRTLNGANVEYSKVIKNHRLTVVSFWATWCKPCKEEIEAISELLPEWQKIVDFDFIAVSVDDNRSAQKVKPTVVSNGWDFPVYLDVNQSLQRAYNFIYIPHMIIYDENGNVVYTHTGYKPGEELELFEIIKSLRK